MTNTITQVTKWYEANVERLSKQFDKTNLRCNADHKQGGAVVEIESSTLVASITLWNKGDVEVLVLKRGSQTPIDLDDRVLSPDESIESLLDKYVEEIVMLK